MIDQPDDAKEIFSKIRVFKSFYIIFLFVLMAIILFPVPATAIPGDNLPGSPIIVNNNVFDLTIVAQDINTGAGIAGVRIYFDGGYQGITSGSKGSLTLHSISKGEHSVRAIHRGYMENIITVHIPEEKEVIIPLHPLIIIPVGDHGPVEDRIDIVFVPSSTQYDCIKQQKVSTDYYTSNEDNFRNDVNAIIQSRFLTLDTITSKSVGLPENFEKKFNFYYYSDPGDYADAFNGCAGTLPADFWEDAPFTDVAIIIYPKYTGTYRGPPCEPNGCASAMGPGVQSWFKAPANAGLVFIHETGHAVFGLIDTYCGETYYTQNDPYPNVWSSQTGCTGVGSINTPWNPSSCHQIMRSGQTSNTIVCQKNFWRYDQEPDIMSTSTIPAKFGDAATLHIRYIFDNINRWHL
jgi:hypothetical protein